MRMVTERQAQVQSAIATPHRQTHSRTVTNTIYFLTVHAPTKFFLIILQHFCDFSKMQFHYVTMLYESGIDPLVAMRIVGHAAYQTTANIYTHLEGRDAAEGVREPVAGVR